MVAIPEPEITTVKLIDQYYETHRERPRPHMGVSLLGHNCRRWLWLSFRWALAPTHSGRLLRLFERGHKEEYTAVANLQKAGMTMTKVLEDQARLSFGSHVSGSPDGIITAGVLEAPNKHHLFECKTHSDKSFKDLTKKGVIASKPMHFAQMCVYGYGLNLDRAIYYAVNKNDDSLHIERVHLDMKHAEKMIKKGQEIALSMRLPEPMTANPEWYECKWCDAYEFCHTANPVAIERHCRTCAYAEPTSDSTWVCHNWGREIPIDAQYEGCFAYVQHGDFEHRGR